MTLLLLILLAAPERAPLWVTFDVLNPQTIGGHRILHLEDVVGPRSKTDIPGLRRPKALLLFATPLSGCGPNRDGLCQSYEQLAKIPGGMVVGVVLVDRETAPRARREIPQTEYSFPLTVDTYGVLGQALKLDRPGVCLVVYSNGEVERFLPPSEGSEQTRWLRQIEARYRDALRQDGEDER